MLITFKEFQNDQSCKTFSWTTAYDIYFQSVFFYNWNQVERQNIRLYF